MDYKFKQIEEKWLKAWDDTEIYKVREDPNKKNSMYLICFHTHLDLDFTLVIPLAILRQI